MSKRDNLYNDPWERDFYETGSTQPPKNHGGVIAVLLVAVILLGGFCSALGLLNIQLLRQLAQLQQEPDSVYLFEEMPGDTGPAEISGSYPSNGMEGAACLGLQGQTVSEFDRRFYEMPRGVLVTAVTESDCADAAGIRNGDVIYSLAGRSITSQEELLAALAECRPGQQVPVEFYRHQTGKNMTVTVTLSEE